MRVFLFYLVRPTYEHLPIDPSILIALVREITLYVLIPLVWEFNTLDRLQLMS